MTPSPVETTTLSVVTVKATGAERAAPVVAATANVAVPTNEVTSEAIEYNVASVIYLEDVSSLSALCRLLVSDDRVNGVPNGVCLARLTSALTDCSVPTAVAI